MEALAFSPDDKLLATAGWDSTVRLWDTATGRLVHVLRGHNNWVTALAFAPDGKRLVTAGWDSQVILWDPATGRQTRVVAKASPFRPSFEHPAAASLGRDGRVRTAGGEVPAKVRGWGTSGTLPAFDIKTDHNSPPAFSPDGTLVAAGGMDHTIRVWDTATGKEQLRLVKHKNHVGGAVFSPDGRYLVSGGWWNQVYVWELATGGIVFNLPAGSDTRFAFTPDGRSLVSAGNDDGARVWDLGTGKTRRHIRLGDPPLALALRHDGKTLAASFHPGVIRLWDFASGKEKFASARIPGEMAPLAFLPGGKRLAVGWADGLGFWDLAPPRRAGGAWSVREVRRLDREVRPLALSADGKRAFATGRIRGGHLWDVAEGARAQKIEGRDLTTAAFSPEGRLLASGGNDHTVLVWDLR